MVNCPLSVVNCPLSVVTCLLSVVNCVAVDEQRIVTGSSDCTLKSWSILSGRCHHDFVGHKAEVVSERNLPPPTTYWSEYGNERGAL